jgi:hypothetical protein
LFKLQQAGDIAGVAGAANTTVGAHSAGNNFAGGAAED